LILDCVCVCVCCVDSLDRARIYIYIYISEVILSADISSGAHREGFLFENLLFASACT
jgi:hypothetical protein